MTGGGCGILTFRILPSHANLAEEDLALSTLVNVQEARFVLLVGHRTLIFGLMSHVRRVLA